jgi:hypothetical protein
LIVVVTSQEADRADWTTIEQMPELPDNPTMERTRSLPGDAVLEANGETPEQIAAHPHPFYTPIATLGKWTWP